jgi:hypothetical protein
MSGWTGHPMFSRVTPATRKARRAAEMTLKAASQLGEAQPASVTVRAVPVTRLRSSQGLR